MEGLRYRRRLGLLLLMGILLRAGSCLAQNSLRGTARTAGNCIQLTDRRVDENGAAWYDQKLDIRTSFSMAFTLNFDTNPTGSDGLMFVMQAVGPDALGVGGEGLGFAGLSPSLGVEFDTFQNPELGDPAYNHLAIHRSGGISHRLPTSLAGPTRIKASKESVKDGLDYLVQVRWDAPARQLTILVDCEERLSVRVDLVNDVFKGSPQVWWGFTASTGGGFSRQTVCLKTNVAQTKTIPICRGEAVQLIGRPSPDNQYNWSPTTGLDNPTSQTPTARPATSQWYTLTTRSVCNTTVRDSFYVDVVRNDCQSVFFVPTAFSPNGDGLNDDLQITSREVSDVELSIYNRWGSLLFVTTDLAKRWDGTSHNVPCDTGVYAYVIRYRSALEPNGPERSTGGQILLLR